MRSYLVLLVFWVVTCAMGASVSWSGLYVRTAGRLSDDHRTYNISGTITDESGTQIAIEGMMFEHGGIGESYLKSYDYSQTSAPVKNCWALMLMGDELNADTFKTATQIELCGYGNYTVGGTAINDPSDFYLVFEASDPDSLEGQTWYGWMHASIGDDKKLHLLGSDIALYGESLIVGGGSTTPEPSSGLLFLLGGAVLALLRRRGARGKP